MFWDSFRKKYRDVGLLLFRVAFGFVFLLHGLQKWGVLNVKLAVPTMPLFLAGSVIEVIGGLLLILGLFTTWVSFLAAGEVAVAYWFMHAFGGRGVFWNPLSNAGEPAVLFCFGLLLLFFLGPGKYSLDAMLKL
jgi:putative oxidoreductase